MEECKKSIFREVCYCDYCFEHAPSESWRKGLQLLKDHEKRYVAGELSSERCKAVTGSEFSSYMGINRFETKDNAIYKKVFNVRTPDNPNMDHGRKYEPIAIAKFERAYKAVVRYVAFMNHPKYTWIGGTFDGVAFFAETGEAAIIEVKCPPKRSISDKVPDYYVPQVQGYLEISGMDTAYFVQYKPAFVTPARGIPRDEKLVVTKVERDPVYINDMLPSLWDAWSEIYVKKWVLNAAVGTIIHGWRFSRKKSFANALKYKQAKEQQRGIREFLGDDMFRNIFRRRQYLGDIMATITDFVPPDAMVCSVIDDVEEEEPEAKRIKLSQF